MRRFITGSTAVVFLVLVGGCGGSAHDDGGGSAGSLLPTGSGGATAGSGGAAAAQSTTAIIPGGAGASDQSQEGGASLDNGVGRLNITIRDFKFYDAKDATTNPDFENVPTTTTTTTGGRGGVGGVGATTATSWDDHDIVADTLGSDSKPVYKNPDGTTLTTHGKQSFDQWYRDVSGTNIHVDYPLTLTDDGQGNYGFDSNDSGVYLNGTSGQKEFFPIDDGTEYATAFGNQGRNHNYSFSVELHTVFTYKGGETFNFRGDDDVFVFINGKKVIDLGGIHVAEPTTDCSTTCASCSGCVVIDSLGLTVGQSYPLDFFYAERHVTESNLRVTTTLELVDSPNIN